MTESVLFNLIKVFIIDGLRFDPDLVLVDYPQDDIARKPYFRGCLGDNMSEEERGRLGRAMATKMVWRLPWLTLHPEVLAVLSRGTLFRSRLMTHLQLLNEDRYYSDKQEAAAIGAAALHNIVSATHPTVLFMVHPQYEDFRGIAVSHLKGLQAQIEADARDIHIEHMIDRFPHAQDLDELNSWYNYPYDYHMSDKGLHIYADTVAEYLIERVTGRLSTPTPFAGATWLARGEYNGYGITEKVLSKTAAEGPLTNGDAILGPVALHAEPPWGCTEDAPVTQWRGERG